MISYEKREQILKLIAVYRKSLSEMSEKEVYYEYVTKYDRFKTSDPFYDKKYMEGALCLSYERYLKRLDLSELMEMDN